MNESGGTVNFISRDGVERPLSEVELLAIVNRWHPLSNEKISTPDHPAFVFTILHPRLGLIAIKKYRARLCVSAFLIFWVTALIWLDLPSPTHGGELVYWLKILFPPLAFAPLFVAHVFSDKAVVRAGLYYAGLADLPKFRTGRGIAVAIAIAVLLSYIAGKILFPRDGQEFIGQFGGVYEKMAQGELWRMFSSLLVHVSLIHVFANVVLLVVATPFVFVHFGNALFPIALVSGGVGALAQWGVAGGGYDAIIGASGFVMSILGAWCAFVLFDSRFQASATVAWSVFLLTGISAFPTAFAAGEVAIWSHLTASVFGFAAASVYCLYIRRKGKQSAPDSEKR